MSGDTRECPRVRGVSGRATRPYCGVGRGYEGCPVGYEGCPGVRGASLLAFHLLPQIISIGILPVLFPPRQPRQHFRAASTSQSSLPLYLSELSTSQSLYLSELSTSQSSLPLRASTSQSSLPLRALYLSELSTSQSSLPLRALYLSEPSILGTYQECTDTATEIFSF